MKIVLTKEQLARLLEDRIILRTLVIAGWGPKESFDEILGFAESRSAMTIEDMALQEVDIFLEKDDYEEIILWK